jgi:hypothetical protein
LYSRPPHQPCSGANHQIHKNNVTPAAPRQEPLDGLARIYADKLLEKTGEEPFPTAKIVEFSLSSVPDSPEAFPSEEDIASQLAPLEAAIGPIGTKLEAVAAQYTAFLAKFDAQAEEGKLDKAKCVVFATESILEVRRSPHFIRAPTLKVSERDRTGSVFSPPVRQPTLPPSLDRFLFG